MDEKIVQLTESSLGRKLVPDVPVFPMVLDKSVLLKDNKDGKYVTLDSIDLLDIIELMERSKFIPFKEYITGTISVENSYNGGTTGDVVYSSKLNLMVLRVFSNDHTTTSYYAKWRDVDSIHGYSSEEYNDGHKVKEQRFFYIADGALTIYKYDTTIRILVPTGTGGTEVDPAYVEQIIDNIFNSYVNTAAHIKRITLWLSSEESLPAFEDTEVDTFVYREGDGMYAKYDDSVDWDFIGTDTIGQFFYYDNSLYEWTGETLVPVIDLEDKLKTYISDFVEWHYITTLAELPLIPDPDVYAEETYYVCNNRVYYVKGGEFIAKNSNGAGNIDGYMFYDARHIYQYKDNSFRTLINFSNVISSSIEQAVSDIINNNTKTINGLSLWKNDDENDNIEVPSIEYVRNYISNLINKDEFLQNSNDPASQKTIYDFVTSYIKNEKGKILVPEYSCAENQLPVHRVVGASWYDTANDQLYRITSDGYENYAAVGEAYLVYLRKMISNVATYDVILFVQTGARSSVAISLTGNGGSGNSGSSGGGSTTTSINSIPFYTPVGWNDDRPGSGYPANSAFFNSATNRLYISSEVDVWGDAPAGSYLLHKSSTSEYYIFDQPVGGSAGVLTPLTVPDAALSTTSKNTVQNKIVTQFINELQDWKGRIILLDGTGTQVPNYFNYWFDNVNQVLLKGTSQGAQVIREGVYIIITPERDKIGVFNADTGVSVQLATATALSTLETTVNQKASTTYVNDNIAEATGKIVTVRVYGPNGTYATYDDWKDGEYYFNTSDPNGGQLWMMGGDNLPKKAIGVRGEAYIMLTKEGFLTQYRLWNVGTQPIIIYTSDYARYYLEKDDFTKWRNRPIPVDYWQDEDPASPSTDEIWYKPSTKTLTYRSGDSWYNLIQGFSATSTYLLLNKNDGCLYVAPNNGNLLKYSSDALHDVYLNGNLVSSREIDGRQAVELNVDSSLFDLTVNKGEVISPVWGELDENETYLEGDYWIENPDDPSDPYKLYKYVYPEGEDELDWVEITSGSYILRSEDNDGEHLYSFTVGQAPTQLATYSEIENLTGGVTGLKIGTGSTIHPDTNGVITISPYIEPSALADYVQRNELGTIQGSISSLSYNIGLASNHGKAVAVSREVTVSSTPIATMFSNYADVDDFSLVMSTAGQLLLEVVDGSSSYYYSNWGPYHNTTLYTKPEIVPSSECKTWDLYFQKDGTDYYFWTWNGSEYVKSPNLGDLALKADKSEVNLLAKIIKIEGLSDENPEDTRMTGISDHYYVLGCYQQNPQPVLCKYTNSGMQPVHISGLYVLCDLREHKLYIYEEITGDSDNYLVGIPTNIDYRTLQQAIPDWIKIVRHFGPTSMNGDGISYSPGDLWYDSSEHLLKYFTTTYEFDEQQSTTSPLLIYNNNETNDDTYPAGLYLYVRGVDVYPAGSTSGTPSSTAGSGAILIKYWQPGTPSGASNGEYWYDTNASSNKLAVRSEGTWRTDLIEQDALYVSPKPSEIVDETQKAYGNTIFRWDGSDLVALSNDDELTSVLTDLATQLQGYTSSLSNIVATAGEDFPQSAVIGQCYFKTGANNTGQPWWYAGNNVWVDANGDPYSA